MIFREHLFAELNIGVCYFDVGIQLRAKQIQKRFAKSEVARYKMEIQNGMSYNCRSKSPQWVRKLPRPPQGMYVGAPSETRVSLRNHVFAYSVVELTTCVFRNFNVELLL